MRKERERHHFSVSELRGIALVICGVTALIFFYSWWFIDGRWQHWWLLLGFVGAVAYGGFQLVGNWLLYLATHYRHEPTAALDVAPTVDVFITAYKEEPALVERALRAACLMRGSYTVWLLDDGEDPRLAQLAHKLGVGYLTRKGGRDAKAGNVNAAFAKTTGELVVIFDIDHAPNPDFLEKTVPYFADPAIGFVQVMLTFENEQDGWVARAAAESSLDFYNPTSIGADGMNSATLVGSNAVIRREALASIGGYYPGLAEDLATSIALHAQGWQSTYVSEPLAPGYAPPDLVAWFTQQLKWARGVFELLVADYPRYLPRLAPGQRLSYAVRMTYYWVGPVFFTHLVATAVVLWQRDTAVLAAYQSYLLHLAPLGFMTLLIRHLALRRWQHSKVKSRSVQWKPMTLVLATWPVYTLAWVMAVLRVPLGFRATPKTKEGGLSIWWILPQMIMMVLITSGMYVSLIQAEGYRYIVVLGFAVALSLPHFFLLSERLLAVVQKPRIRQSLAAIERSLHL